MGEEFQAWVCGSTWWSSPRGSLGLSPCLMTMNDFGSFGWPNDHLVEMKARSNTTRDVSDSISDHVPTLFQDIQKPSQPGSGDRVFMDSTLQMMGIGLSSSSSITTTTTDWNQTLISGSGRNENNYHSSVLQESGFNPPSNQSPKEWSVKNFSQNSNINELKQTNQGFPMESTFPMASSSYGFPSTLIQTLFDDDPLPVLENQTVNFPSTTANYRTNMNDFSPSLAKLPSLLGPPLAKQQAISTPLHLTSNTPFWNASTGAPSASIFPSTQLNFLKLTTKANNEAVQESKKSSGEPAFKRQRIETPSPLPTFKVRKEKLGDRVTALQQLVSPFGKTDTASVLQEAIEYIKFLHDQVNVFSTSYMKNGAPIHQQQNYDKLKDLEGPKQDLKSRGLCLVPISSTFPVANETAVDFWTPTFGGQFR